MPYEVRLDGTTVWPEASAGLPPSTIRFTDPRRPLDVVFGSCRITRPHEPPYALRAHEHPDGQGVDALRAYALRARRPRRAAACPDMLLLLGDQIYADEPSPALREQLAERDRPRRRAGGRARGLRRVRAGVPGGVVRAGHPMAALDGPGDDGLRRPRDPRRMADLPGLDGRDERRAVVRPPHPVRADGLLGVPAPRQPLARGPRATPSCSARSGRRATPRSCWPRTWTGGPPDRPQPLELRARRRATRGWSSSTRARAGRDARPTAPDPRRGVGVGPRAGAAPGPSSAARQLGAVPPGPRAPPRRGVRRGARPTVRGAGWAPSPARSSAASP